jgi:hypothetical protein
MERRNNLLRLATDKLAHVTGLERQHAEEKVRQAHLNKFSKLY